MKYFVEICKMPQAKLHKYLFAVLKEYGYEVYDGDKYILGVGSNVLVTAHMDTVHKENVKTVKYEKDKYGDTIISSPQGIGGDDRCGIYIILSLLEDGYRPTILFTEDEELGGLGAEAFVKDSLENPMLENAITACGYMIELDRAHDNDAVFYECDNPEFTEFIEKETGYKETWGSFSDISVIAPHFERAAVNLSCGYYKAHTTDEFVVWEEMLHTVKVVEGLLDQKVEKFEYIEADIWHKYSLGYTGTYGLNYGLSYKDEYDEPIALGITYRFGNSDMYSEAWGYDKNEALVEFFTEHPDVCFNDIKDVEEISYYL